MGQREEPYWSLSPVAINSIPSASLSCAVELLKAQQLGFIGKHGGSTKMVSKTHDKVKGRSIDGVSNRGSNCGEAGGEQLILVAFDIKIIA